MWERLRDFWLPRILFAVTIGLAALLAAMVLLAPWLATEIQSRFVSLFARDVIVRRTTVASAAGLAVTACVFFRPGGYLFFRSQKDRNHLPPPMAGA
jgi:hypothetical protein